MITIVEGMMVVPGTTDPGTVVPSIVVMMVDGGTVEPGITDVITDVTG